jgi:hypothetical protein
MLFAEITLVDATRYIITLIALQTLWQFGKQSGELPIVRLCFGNVGVEFPRRTEARATHGKNLPCMYVRMRESCKDPIPPTVGTPCVKRVRHGGSRPGVHAARQGKQP